MRKVLLTTLLGTLFLAGCATGDYKLYADTQRAIAASKAQAEVARYAALAEIAKTGDSGAKVAAVLSIQMGAGPGGQTQAQIAAPRNAGDTILQWTSVLLPSLTQLYSVNANKNIAVTQSNNAAAVAMSTNTTMANIAGSGFNSVTTVANSGLSAATTLGTAGLTTASTISGQGTTALQGVVTNYNSTINSMNQVNGQTIQGIVDTIPQLQPNVTTTTTTTTNNAP